VVAHPRLGEDVADCRRRGKAVAPRGIGIEGSREEEAVPQEGDLRGGQVAAGSEAGEW
jgi:hypothetical protein